MLTCLTGAVNNRSIESQPFNFLRARPLHTSCEMNFRNGDRCTGKHVFGPVLAVAGRNRQTAAFLCGPFAEKPALNFLASATRLARRAAPSKTAAFLIIIYHRHDSTQNSHSSTFEHALPWFELWGAVTGWGEGATTSTLSRGTPTRYPTPTSSFPVDIPASLRVQMSHPSMGHLNPHRFRSINRKWHLTLLHDPRTASR